MRRAARAPSASRPRRARAIRSEVGGFSSTLVVTLLTLRVVLLFTRLVRMLALKRASATQQLMGQVSFAEMNVDDDDYWGELPEDEPQYD